MTIYQGRFAGRTAVITGGASGLGLEAGRRIAAEGGRVALWDMNPDALAAAKTQTGAVLTVALDVSKPEAVEAAAARSKEALGKIDILINSAGITGATHTVIGYPIESWVKVFDVNVHGLFYCCRAIAPGTRSRYHAKSSPPRLWVVLTWASGPTIVATASASSATAPASLTTGGTPRT